MDTLKEIMHLSLENLSTLPVMFGVVGRRSIDKPISKFVRHVLAIVVAGLMLAIIGGGFGSWYLAHTVDAAHTPA